MWPKDVKGKLVSSLKPGELAFTRFVHKNKNILCIWVAEILGQGEMVQFENYENYNDYWIVQEIEKIDTYENCMRRYKREEWFLRKVKHE